VFIQYIWNHINKGTMKARLLFIGLLTVSFGYGQLKIVEVADLGTDVDQTTIEEIGLATDNEIIKVVWIVNTGNTALSLKCKKTEIDVLSGTMNTTCWKLCPSVYDLAGAVSSGFVTLGGNQMIETVSPGDTIKTFAGHYKPENLDGCSLFRYDWYDENDLNTALASVNIRYVHTTGTCTAGVEESDVNVSIKLVPNPASQNVNINMSEIYDFNDISLEIYDMLGKKVSSIAQVGPNNNLNVSEFKNGMYFISIMKKGSLIKTSKLIKE
jgi:hypothetical protein|tara:strand:+ start:138 stop:944 length:807 start_codon:yes stop_codon:yes gene_type:complete